MTRLGNMYGPDATFLGVPPADLADRGSWAGSDILIIGAPFDGGTSHRPGARFGPQAIRFTDYLPHDGSRPHLALGVDPLAELRIADAGDIEMPSGDTELSLRRLEEAVQQASEAGAIPVILGGDHTIAFPDATGVARHVGWGRLSVIHFDAHADTGDTQFGSLYGHGTPMRRLIESGAVRGDRFLQIGLRGYWPEPETLAWMAAQNMRSYEMTEVVTRGLDECLTEAFGIATDECDGVFLSVDVDVVDPGMAPGTGTPEPGGLTGRQLLDAVRRIAMELPLAGVDVVEVAPPYDHAEITAFLASRVVLEALSGIAWRRRLEAAAPGRPATRSRRCWRAAAEPAGRDPEGLRPPRSAPGVAQRARVTYLDGVRPLTGVANRPRQLLQALGIRWIDVGAAALVAGLVELNVVVGGGPGAAPLNAVAYVFGGILALPIIVRRRWPLGSLIACSVLLLLYYSLDRRNISPAPLLSLPLYDAAVAGYLAAAIAIPAVLHGRRPVRGGRIHSREPGHAGHGVPAQHRGAGAGHHAGGSGPQPPGAGRGDGLPAAAGRRGTGGRGRPPGSRGTAAHRPGTARHGGAQHGHHHGAGGVRAARARAG